PRTRGADRQGRDPREGLPVHRRGDPGPRAGRLPAARRRDPVEDRRQRPAERLLQQPEGPLQRRLLPSLLDRRPGGPMHPIIAIFPLPWIDWVVEGDAYPPAPLVAFVRMLLMTLRPYARARGP